MLGRDNIFVVLRYGLRFLLLTTATLLVVLAVFTGLLRLGLPYASTYKNDIQAWVSDYLGSPVEIGSMTVAWSGLSPRLALDNIALNRGGKNKVDVKLDQIQLDLNLFKSLAMGDLHTNEVTISGVDLSVEYFGRRNFKVSGIGFPESSTEDTEADDSSLDVLSWLMNANRVGLLNSRIKLIDKVRGIDYQLTDLNIRAENTSRFHQLRVDLGLPEQLGNTLELGLDLHGSRNALAVSTGSFYLNAASVNVQDWMSIWPARTLEASGRTDMELWGSWGENLLQSLRVKSNGSDITLATKKSVESTDDSGASVAYPTMVADLSWQRGAGGWVAEIDRLDVMHDDVLNSVQNTVVRKEEREGTDHFSIAAQGDALRLDSISQLFATFSTTPALETIARYAQETVLSGDLVDWELKVETNPGVDSGYDSRDDPLVSLKADLKNVSSQTYKQVPGFQNLTASVAVEKNAGFITIDSTDFSIQHPGLFPRPLSLAKVEGKFQIDLNDRQPILSSDAVSISNDGLESTTSLSIIQTDGLSFLDINSEFSLADASTVVNYLPTGVLRPRLNNWLANAFITGEVSSGKLRFSGKPTEFPFAENNGEFRVDFNVAEGALRFRPDWPVATEVDGSVTFEGAALRFSASKGNIAGTRVSRFSGGIQDMRRPVLTLSGANNGPLNNFLKFANTGPLNKILSPALAESNGSGNVVMNLEVAVPLRAKKWRQKDEVLRVDGALFLKDNDVTFDKFNLAFDAVTGAVVFSEQGITVNQISAGFLGSNLQVDAKTFNTKSGRQTDISVIGQVHIDRVLDRYQIPVGSFFNGPSRWQVDVLIPYGSRGKSYPGVVLKASSDMLGTAITFPKPMNKSSGAARPVSVSTRFKSGGSQIWRISDGKMKTQVRVKAGDGMQSLAVLLGKGSIPDGFARGIRVEGSAPIVSFDGWIAAISRIISELPKGTGTPVPLMPVFARVRAVSMQVGQRLLGSSTLRVNTEEAYINGVIDNQHLRGNIRLPRKHWDAEQPVKVRIAHADKTLLDALKTKQPIAGESGKPIDPRIFPRLEIRVSELMLPSVTLKEVGIRTEPDDAGMTISAIGFSNDTAQMVGSGIWHLKDPQLLNAQLDGQQISRFDLNVQSADVGSTLADLGIVNAMAEGNGSVRATLGWQDAVYKPDLASLAGDGEIYIKNGRILSIEPGAAKLVGLFALQELPRRLSLDFRDIVNDGLDYKTISGSVKINNGVVATDLLQLKGPVGVVDITGTSNLVTRTFDQKIQVLPRVSAALPIIGLLSGGATAGIGALLATPVLKALGIDLDRIGLTDYTLKGGWNNPKIVRLTPKSRGLLPDRD